MSEYQNPFWHKLGGITLYTLIGFGLACLTTFSIDSIWFWVAAIGGCFVCVILAEIVSFIRFKKSISQQYGDWIQRSPVKAYAGLGFFSLAMISLILHLVAYGLRGKKK